MIYQGLRRRDEMQRLNQDVFIYLGKLLTALLQVCRPKQEHCLEFTLS